MSTNLGLIIILMVWLLWVLMILGWRSWFCIYPTFIKIN